jgi:N-acetylglucosamine malate deacetylase 1
MNVLVIAPHPDDEAIGCGGTIRLHIERGDRVVVVFLTSGELGGLKHLHHEEAWAIREREAEAAAEVLGVATLAFLRCPDYRLGDQVDEAASALQPVLEREAPATVYLPHVMESHPDHRAALPITRAALGGAGMPGPTLWTYEVWTPLSRYSRVQDVTSVMRCKLEAVRRHRSQVTQYRYDRAVLGLNRYRGVLAGRCRYAEVFDAASEGPGPCIDTC